MSALHVHIEPADDPAFIMLRFSLSPNPERKEPQRVERVKLGAILAFLLDESQKEAA